MKYVYNSHSLPIRSCGDWSGLGAERCVKKRLNQSPFLSSSSSSSSMQCTSNTTLLIAESHCIPLFSPRNLPLFSLSLSSPPLLLLLLLLPRIRGGGERPEGGEHTAGNRTDVAMWQSERERKRKRERKKKSK